MEASFPCQYIERERNERAREERRRHHTEYLGVERVPYFVGYEVCSEELRSNRKAEICPRSREGRGGKRRNVGRKGQERAHGIVRRKFPASTRDEKRHLAVSAEL